jgi:hypothetical protein
VFQGKQGYRVSQVDLSQFRGLIPFDDQLTIPQGRIQQKINQSLLGCDEFSDLPIGMNIATSVQSSMNFCGPSDRVLSANSNDLFFAF